jgi:hypothetical protein
MSNELTLANAQVPAHLAGRVGKPSVLAESMAGGISGESVPRISIKGSRFRIVEGGTETVLPITALDIVVVGANPNLSKLWYAKPWSADDEPTQADCFSLGGVTPDRESNLPQNDLCATCPQNAWGSKITPDGKKVKACADQKRLAVVAADDPTGTVYLLQVTPAALKGLNAYQKGLTVRGFSPEIVKTRIEFDTDASFPKLKFGFAGFLDDTVQIEVDKLFGTQVVTDITGEQTTYINAPATAAPAATPEPTPEPTSQPAPVEEPAPANVVGFGAAAKAAREAKEAELTSVPAEAAAPTGPAPVTAEPAPIEASTDAQKLAAEIASLVGGTADDAE